MGFPQSIADEVFVRCGRHCCLCGKYAGQKMELHHIKQVADGGDDSIDNCIPLCLDCHADVKAYNPKHPKGRRFTETELKGHRDKYYAKHETTLVAIPPVEASDAFMDWFDRSASDNEDNPVWGYPQLDKDHPIVPGTIILVAGYNSSGKSIYAQHVIRKNLPFHKRIVYFNLKDGSEQVLKNMLAAEAMLNVSNLQRNLLTAEEWYRLSAATHYLNIKNLRFVPFNMISSMDEQLLLAVKDSGAHIIVVDDIGALGLHSDSERESFMYKLRSLAIATGTVVFLLSNLIQKNARFDDRPILDDFESDSIYRFCDVIQFVYRNTYHDDIDMYVKKVEIITVKYFSQEQNKPMVLAALPNYPVLSPLAESTELG